MADAADTMRYLVKSFDIAPAGTREEGQAAKSLAEVFHEHGLQTANKSFRFSNLSKVAYAASALLMALVGILSGVAEGALPIVTLVLGIAAAAVFFLERMGVRTVSRLNLTGSSQNIVACHPAATTVNGQKARPVVVIAHYDTPRADIFALPPLSKLQPYLRPVMAVCMAVDLGMLLLQVLPLPQLLHNIAWAVAVVASVLLLLWGASILLQRFVMPFTVGANDNKAAIAAMFGLLDRVRPLQGGPGFGPNDALYEAMEAEAGDGMIDRAAMQVRVSERRAPEAETEPTVRRRSSRSRANGPVRYGADVVRSLGILPADCVLEYEQAAPAEPAPRVHRASEAASAAEIASAVDGMTVVISREEVAAAAQEAQPSLSADPEAAKDAAADAIMAGIVGTSVPSGDAAPAPVTEATSLMAPVDPEAVAVSALPAQPFRVITSSDDYDAELRSTTAAMPRDVAVQSAEISTSFNIEDPESLTASVVNDPSWGTSSFRPVVATGRRILSDIPDPAVAAVDPFSVSSIDPVGGYNPEDFSQMDFETGRHQALTPQMLEAAHRNAMSGFGDDITETKRNRKSKRGRQGRISHQAARMQAEMEEESFNDWLGLEDGFDAKTSGQQIGSWSNFADPQDTFASTSQSPQRWQGGAARARSRSHGTDQGGASSERRAAMTLGDRELIAHEIWFVLTGASEADHAGVEDFLKTYRADLRGAYFINLECVGAGRQSLVLEEGQSRRAKADRRLVNLFGEASMGINRPLALTRMGWRDSEATPLLRQGCRAVTVAGVKDGAPAHARWVGDTPEKVDASMIDDVVDMMVEVIKNA